jgi:hypothetical protein
MGVGSFMYEQIEHAARLRGCTHIVLEVAENNEQALKFYRARNFFKLDAAIFLARKLETEQELLPRAGSDAARPSRADSLRLSYAGAPMLSERSKAMFGCTRALLNGEARPAKRSGFGAGFAAMAALAGVLALVVGLRVWIFTPFFQ